GRSSRTSFPHRLPASERANSRPSHPGPVATDSLELQLGDAAMRHEIPVLAKRIRLAGHDRLLHVLRGFPGKRGVAGADAFQVVSVRAAHLGQMEAALVQAVDLGGAGSARYRRIERLHRIEVDLRRRVLHDAVEGAVPDAAG